MFVNKSSNKDDLNKTHNLCLQAKVELLHFFKHFIELLLFGEVILQYHMNATCRSLCCSCFTKGFLLIIKRMNTNLGRNKHVGNTLFLTKNRNVRNYINRSNIGSKNDNTIKLTTIQMQAYPFSFLRIDFTTSFTPRRVHLALAATTKD